MCRRCNKLQKCTEGAIRLQNVQKVLWDTKMCRRCYEIQKCAEGAIRLQKFAEGAMNL